MSNRVDGASDSRLRNLILLTLLSAVVLIAGCYGERPTQVTLEGQANPDFVFSGSGKLTDFSVYIVSPPDFDLGRTVKSLSAEAFFTEPAVWRVETTQADIFQARLVENVGHLAYGVVPPGYKQMIPADGSAPSPFLSGKKYFFECSTVNAPGASGFFEIIEGKPVPSQVSLPCLQNKNGKQVTVPCIEH